MRQIIAVSAEGVLSPAMMLPPMTEAMALDFEATGPLVYARGFAPRLCQVSFDGDTAFVLNAVEHRDLIISLVRTAPKLIVHNASYDLVVLERHYGIPLEESWPKTDDTLDMARLLYPTESGKLKDHMRLHAGFETDSDKALRAEFTRLKLRPIAKGYETIPLDNGVFLRYAGLDPIGTYRLWRQWREQIEPGMLRVESYQHYQAACITRRGLLCDVDETRRQLDLLADGIDEATDRLTKRGLPTNIATDVGRQALDDYLTENGAAVTRTPKSGKMCIKADALKLSVAEADDDAKAAIDDLVLIRQASKIKVAYLESFLDSAELDGRVHPSIKTMAARTHRWSISEPPLQQIPSHPFKVKLSDLKGEFEREADTRGCLVADPGCVLVGADYSQIEQRVIATLAEQYDLIDAIKAGIDFHKALASNMFRTSVDAVDDKQRSTAKHTGYGIIYGGGAKTLALKAGITIPQAQRVIKQFKQTYPKIISYSDSLQHKEEIVTPFGRHLPIDESRRYAATNYMIQSTARDLFVTGGVNIVNAGYGKYLWLPIHDEWILNVPEEIAENVAEHLAELMYIDFYGTPITAEGVVLGKRWRKS
jgi:DNA polymerase I